jgi:hypothetical protein
VRDGNGVCTAAAILVAWMLVVFVSVVAALAQSPVWTVFGAGVLVVVIVCTLVSAEQLAREADSSTATGHGEIDERVDDGLGVAAPWHGDTR